MDASTSSANQQAHKYWGKLQTIPTELQIFLKPHVDLQQKKITKEKMEEIMKYFEIDAALIPKRSKLKAAFIEAYQKHLEPELRQLLNPEEVRSQAKAEKENKKRAALLSHTTASLKELRAAIITRIRESMVSPTFSKAALRRFWMHLFIGPVTDPPSEFAERPHFFTADEMRNKSRDVLRHALQCECPWLFIPLSACTEPILQALYERFVIDNEDLDEQLCLGVHYYMIPDPHELESDDDSMKNDSVKDD